jgi:citrate/tricarballylate utilization protein
MPWPDLVPEAGRQLAVCNACRYCEGYCAVFGAAERRPQVTLGDLVQLANLCHDCRACYQACMYAPPHPFGVDLPDLFARARRRAYRRYVWPGALGGALGRPALAAAGASAAAAALALAAALAGAGPAGVIGAHLGPGAFYRVVAYPVMLVGFLALTALVLLPVALGCGRMWQETGGGPAIRSPRLWARALFDAASLRLLSGAGGGCYRAEPGPSQALRRLHQLLVAGFLLTFGATLAAAVEQDLLGRLPPYPVLSVPVGLGIVGGLGIVVAASALLVQERRDRLGLAFLALSEAVAVSGLLLLALRTTSVMGALLVLHLALVAALFLTLPYGKLIHAPLRLLALVREQAETRAE